MLRMCNNSNKLNIAKHFAFVLDRRRQWSLSLTPNGDVLLCRYRAGQQRK